MIIYNSLLINHGGGDIIMQLYASYTRMRVCIYTQLLGDVITLLHISNKNR